MIPRLILASVALALLSACATRPTPAAPPPPLESVEPLPSGIQPLTTEQDEFLAE